MPDAFIDWCNETFCPSWTRSQTNQSVQKAINHPNLTWVGFVMTVFASIKPGRAIRPLIPATLIFSSTAKNFTWVKSLIWWIHIGYINIPYLGPVKTVDRINVFTLKLRDVLLTLSHRHLNQWIDPTGFYDWNRRLNAFSGSFVVRRLY